MKIEKEFRDDHQVKLTVELDPEPVESAKHRAARKIARRVKIPGFRPGKAPYGVVLRQVGESQVLEEALEILIDEQYPEVLKEADIKPYGPGRLENVTQLDPPVLEFIVPLDVEIELGDYQSLRIPYEMPETSDVDVDNAIERIRTQHAARENVERPAAPGDTVFMQIGATRLNVDEEGDATLFEERFSSAVLSEDEKEDEWPFPGFSKALIGLSKDDEKTIRHEYPEDHPEETYQGITAEFKVVITNIQAITLPDIDDELAKSASEFDTLEAWKTELKTSLTAHNQSEYEDSYNEQILNEIVSQATIKYPPQIVEEEKRSLLSGLEYRLSQQGLTKDLYLQIRGIKEDELIAELSTVAEDKVKRDLVLMEIAKVDNIKADPGKVQFEMGRTMQAISKNMTPNEARKLTQSQYLPTLASNITAELMTQAVMEYLRATAKGEEWPPEDTTPASVESEAEPAEGIPAEGEPVAVLEQNEQEGDAVTAPNEVPTPEVDNLAVLEVDEKPQEEEISAEEETDG